MLLLVLPERRGRAGGGAGGRRACRPLHMFQHPAEARFNARLTPALPRPALSPPSPPTDGRALWLDVVQTVPGGVVLQLPKKAEVLIPGMYMLVLHTADRNVHSDGKIISVHAK